MVGPPQPFSSRICRRQRAHAAAGAWLTGPSAARAPASPRPPQTTVKDALKKLQETLEEGQKVEDLEDVRLCMIPWQMPLITKMDASLGTLKKCKHLRISSNQLDKIGSLAGMGEPPDADAPRPRLSRPLR